MGIRRGRWNVRLPDGDIVAGLSRRQAERLLEASLPPVIMPVEAAAPPAGSAIPGEPILTKTTLSHALAESHPAGPTPAKEAGPPPGSGNLLYQSLRHAIDDPGLLQVPRLGYGQPDLASATGTVLACQVPRDD